MLAHTTKHWHPLAHTTRTHVLQVEFTTRCDLKCTYCAVSQPYWNGTDLDLTQFNYDDLITTAKQRKAKVLNLHGHGETTMLPGWVEYATKAVDSGIPVTICSNFAHLHTPEETAVLARFQGITISIDTVDPDLYKRLRRGSDLRNLLFNMLRLRAVAGDSLPRLTWCCVLTDLNCMGMLDLVKQGLDLGVRTFCICNLHVLPTPKGGVELRHISTLPRAEAVAAGEILMECRRYCEERGAKFDLKAGLTDTLMSRVL